MGKIEKKASSDKQILKKHVAAIHIGAPLSLLQRKLVNALLYNAYDGLLTNQSHTISAAVLCEMIGFDSKNIAYLKAALKGLMETVVEFDVLEEDGKSSWEAMVLLSYARIKDGECTYRYERALAEKLYHPDVYSKINLSVLREMNSAHALVLYENCYRYVDIGHTAWWDVDVFRKLMAVDTMPSYKPFKALNRNVIQPAMKEVNKLSNIQVFMETVMQGRTVTSLRFIVRPNAQLSLIGMEEDDAINSSPAYKALLAEGISKTLARAWVLEHEEGYIFEKLELANGQAAKGKITSSKAGFLKAAIEEDFKSEASVKKQKQKQEDIQRDEKRKNEAALGDLRKALKEMELLHRGFCTEKVERVLEALSESEQERAEGEFRASLESRIYTIDFDKKGWGSPLLFPDVCRFWSARGVEFPALPEFTLERRMLHPDAIRDEIKRLEALLS